MKLKSIKPIFFGGTVLTEGQEFETNESHGRELKLKGYAAEVTGQTPAEQEQEQAETVEVKTDKKAKK